MKLRWITVGLILSLMIVSGVSGKDDDDNRDDKNKDNDNEEEFDWDVKIVLVFLTTKTQCLLQDRAE